MPLIRIDVIEGRSEADIAAISDAVHQALVSVAGVPERDQFQRCMLESPRTFRSERRPAQDVFIVLSLNARADWSFGNGGAHSLELPREQWR